MPEAQVWHCHVKHRRHPTPHTHTHPPTCSPLSSDSQQEQVWSWMHQRWPLRGEPADGWVCGCVGVWGCGGRRGWGGSVETREACRGPADRISKHKLLLNLSHSRSSQSDREGSPVDAAPAPYSRMERRKDGRKKRRCASKGLTDKIRTGMCRYTLGCAKRLPNKSLLPLCDVQKPEPNTESDIHSIMLTKLLGTFFFFVFFFSFFRPPLDLSRYSLPSTIGLIGASKPVHEAAAPPQNRP